MKFVFTKRSSPWRFEAEADWASITEGGLVDLISPQGPHLLIQLADKPARIYQQGGWLYLTASEIFAPEGATLVYDRDAQPATEVTQ